MSDVNVAKTIANRFVFELSTNDVQERTAGMLLCDPIRIQ